MPAVRPKTIAKMSSRPVIDHQRQEARHDQVLDRVDAEHLQGVELLADLAGAEVGGDRGAGDAADDHRGDHRPDQADRGHDEEAAEPVEARRTGEDAGGLQPGRAQVRGRRSRSSSGTRRA